VNKPTPTRLGDTLDWLHEQGKRRASTVPEFDPEVTLSKLRAARDADSYALSPAFSLMEPLPGAAREPAPAVGQEPAPAAIRESLAAPGMPHYRAIVALDIEGSTRRPSSVKAELRNMLYELFDAALRAAGIGPRHRDRFVDRGDGLLALIHPADKAPEAVLLNRVVPALGLLLAEYNASLPQQSQQQRQLRVRVVMHAGEVHYDSNGCFGEALDVAFRLLDAARVKRLLREAADPLILVVSENIYSSVVRHGDDGTNHEGFHQLVRVNVAGKRCPGWVHLPPQDKRQTVTQMASYRRPS
jgi:class 3 adenylate cyclase